LSIFRRYEWRHAGRDFHYEAEWPKSWLQRLESLDHSYTEPDQYEHYLNNDPYEDELGEFLEEIVALGEKHLDFQENRDVFEYLLSFVQHLRCLEERGDYPRYPMETIIDRGGDCEDTGILMGFIAEQLDYEFAFIHFHKDGFLGIGSFGHIDLGIVASYPGEFSGTYWEKDGMKYYYVHCNGRFRKIGEYSGKWGNHATIHPY